MAKATADDVRGLKWYAPELGEEVTVVDDEEELRRLRVNAILTASAGNLWPYKLIAFILEMLIKKGYLNLQGIERSSGRQAKGGKTLSPLVCMARYYILRRGIELESYFFHQGRHSFELLDCCS